VMMVSSLAMILLSAAAQLPRGPVNTFKMTNPAVATVVPGVRSASEFPGQTAGIILTTFNVGNVDGVWTVKDAGKLINSSTSTATVTQVDKSIHWPNMADIAPAGAFEGTSVILEAGGFFVSPSKSTGQVILTDVTEATPTNFKISTDKKSYFYHQALWHDINGDGKLDVLAARAFFPTIPTPWNKAKGDLIWMEHPASGDPLTTPWVEHDLVVGNGPDVAFIFEEIQGKFVVLAGQFFDAKQLAMYWCDDTTWSSCNAAATTMNNGTQSTANSGTAVQSIVIDKSIGGVFNLQYIDVNGDGRKDLLVTNNRNDGKGGVYVYELPGDIFAPGAKWTRHELASGFKPVNPLLPGQGGPGTARAIQPNLKKSQLKPTIFVTGDDNGTVAILTAVNPSTHDDWNYTVDRLCKGSGTIGSIGFGDLNNDGYTDLVVPMFKDGRVDIYTFAP